MKAIMIATALVVASAGFAGAAEAQKSQAPAPVVKAQTMTDSEMDKVTAGAYISTNQNDVYPMWSETGQINAGHGFNGQGSNAARCYGCGL